MPDPKTKPKAKKAPAKTAEPTPVEATPDEIAAQEAEARREAQKRRKDAVALGEEVRKRLGGLTPPVLGKPNAAEEWDMLSDQLYDLARAANAVSKGLGADYRDFVTGREKA